MFTGLSFSLSSGFGTEELPSSGDVMSKPRDWRVNCVGRFRISPTAPEEGEYSMRRITASAKYLWDSRKASGRAMIRQPFSGRLPIGCAELTEERHRQAKLGTKIENVEWETLGDGGQRELKGAQDSTPNPLASAASVGGGKYQKEGAQDFDLMIKGQQAVNVIYDGSESSQDDLAFESHPLQDSCFDDLDLDLMD